MSKPTPTLTPGAIETVADTPGPQSFVDVEKHPNGMPY